MFSESQLVSICEVSQLFVLLPLIIILFRFKRFGKIFRIVAILIISSCIISLLAYLLYSRGENNMPLLHLYTVIEFLLWSLIYYNMVDGKGYKKTIIGFSVIFILFSILNVVFWQLPFEYNSYSRSAEAFILLCFAIAWFYRTFVDGDVQVLESYPLFWLNAAVLVYFSGSFLLFIFNNFMIELGKQQVLAAWALHGIFLGIHYLLISIGAWLKTDKKVLH